MGRLGGFRYREVVRKLKLFGFEFDCQAAGSHEIWLNAGANRYTFTVEGNADERGTREYNFALGARRAETVKQYLAARGIAASRMRTISYGKERPVAVCNDISCWSQNRRVVTVLGGGQS